MEVDRAGAYKTAARIFSHVISSDSIPECSVIKGDRLAARCARSFITEDRKSKYAQVALSIWLRKNWNVSQLISCVAGTTMIHNYTWYHFHSLIENLPVPKQVLVTVLSLHPRLLRLDPMRLLTSRNFHIKRLTENGWISPEYCKQMLSGPLGMWQLPGIASQMDPATFGL